MNDPPTPNGNRGLAVDASAARGQIDDAVGVDGARRSGLFPSADLKSSEPGQSELTESQPNAVAVDPVVLMTGITSPPSGLQRNRQRRHAMAPLDWVTPPPRVNTASLQMQEVDVPKSG
jgi:hypothetical protein